MESDWRFNVWQFGLSGMGIKYAAVAFTLPPVLITNNPADPTTYLVWDISGVPTQLPFVIDVVPTAGASFPFGVAVAPDPP